MNEYDWWADYSLDEARKNYTKWQIKSCGIGKEDVDVDDVIELSWEKLDSLKYYNEDTGKTTTFKEELLRIPKKGFFASTEW